jgi:NADP-dependent 3-hydroxy acid dehydrogenase YdfG
MELRAGKVAVVTGAASGIGLALAERFARAGLDVVLADVEKEALRAAAKRIQALGVKSLAVTTDVSDETAVQALDDAAVDRFGAVHVVCNNAGVSGGGDPWFGPISSWRWAMGVNLWGVIHGIRAFLPVMVAQGEGHIVNTSSIAGLIPGAGPSYDGTNSDPRHVIAYDDGEVRQQFSICFRARPIGGTLSSSSESSAVLWVTPGELDGLNIHPSMRLRIDHGLDRSLSYPYIG